MGPELQFSDELHAQKYRADGESFEAAMSRIANALKDSPEHFKNFQDILQNQRFLPGGRVQGSMGATRIVSPINCFMSGDITDSFVHDSGSIMQRATEAAATMRLGGGIGTNFSTLRPKGAHIRKLNSASSGSVSFMHIFNSIGLAIASSGHRRGAQMGVLRVDHPDIEQFIHAKNNSTDLTGFNISILVTNEFMDAVMDGKSFDLRFEGEVYKTIDAATLWESIMRSTYDYAEPGVLFIDTINDNNNLSYVEEITGTNPCGEIPLPAYGACLLGSFNLVKYVRKAHFDYELLEQDIPECVRALDNVIDRASVWPLPEQEQEMKAKRRIGIGPTGLANAGEALGFAYGSPGFVSFTQRVMSVLQEGVYRASMLLAKEKGAFPLYDRDKFQKSKYVQSLSREVQDGIKKYGIRNSHLLAIAPTGTISLCADNVSSGIEPVFAHEFDRTVFMADGQRTESVQDYGVREFGVRGKTVEDLTPQEHLDVLAACAPYVDQSISKTINVPQEIPWEDFKNIYMDAYLRGCKGVTTYRTGGKRDAILTAQDSCYIDPETGRRECG